MKFTNIKEFINIIYSLYNFLDFHFEIVKNNFISKQKFENYIKFGIFNNPANKTGALLQFIPKYIHFHYFVSMIKCIFSNFQEVIIY